MKIYATISINNKLHMETPQPSRSQRKKLTSIFNDPLKSAEAINLTYIADAQEGITPVNRKEGFDYLPHKLPVKNEKH